MIPLDEELIEEILRTLGGLLFIYPLKEVLKVYLDTLKNKKNTDKLIEYHFPSVYKFLIRLKGKTKKE